MDDSCIALVEALVDDAIARQQARRVTRDDCLHEIAKAIRANWGSFCCSSVAGCKNRGGCACWADAEVALDAAIASGYVQTG